MTNYLTNLNSEMELFACEICRLMYCSTEEYFVQNDFTEKDKELMLARLEATKKLHRILVEQYLCFECEEGDEEYKAEDYDLDKIGFSACLTYYDEDFGDFTDIMHPLRKIPREFVKEIVEKDIGRKLDDDE